jgi:hypothetical protein
MLKRPNKMPAPAIHLYFYRSRASLSLQVIAIGLLATLLLVGCYQYWKLSNQISQKTTFLNQRIGLSTYPKTDLKLSTQETLSVEKALSDINFPWTRPFEILEASHDAQVNLLEVHHEPIKHDIRLMAQTSDIESMFDYINKLKKTTHVRRVILNSQESLDDETHPIMFTLTISWI